MGLLNLKFSGKSNVRIGKGILILLSSKAFFMAIIAIVLALSTSKEEVDLIQKRVSKFMELSPNSVYRKITSLSFSTLSKLEEIVLQT